MAKAKRKNTIRMGDKKVSYETSLFAPSGHTIYSGFGCHQDKQRKAARRERKMEEKRAKLGDY